MTEYLVAVTETNFESQKNTVIKDQAAYFGCLVVN